MEPKKTQTSEPNSFTVIDPKVVIATTSTAHTNPPHFRWLRRSIIFVLCLVALMAVTRWFWAWRVERQIVACIKDLRDHGQPALPADVTPLPITAAPGNRADLYIRAIAARVETAADRAWEFSNTWENSGLKDADANALSVIAQENAAARALVRQARTQQGVDWNVHRRSMLAQASLLNQLRTVSNLLHESAIAEHFAGNDFEAVELLRDQIALASTMDEDCDSAVMHFVAGTFASFASNDIELFGGVFVIQAPGSVPSTDPAAVASFGRLPTSQRELRSSTALSLAGNPATEAQIKSLSAELQDERAFHAATIRGMQIETVGTLDAIATPVQPTLPAPTVPPAIFWLLWPEMHQGELQQVANNQKLIIAIQQPNLQSASHIMPSIQISLWSRRAFPSLMGRLGSSPPGFAYGLNFLQFQFKVLTARRASATLLAIDLYRADHEQQLPASLAALVPQYLQALPADPMRSDGQTFGYHPGGASPFIYSVSLDGVDDGGSTAPAPTTPMGGKWHTRDEIYSIGSK